MGGANSTEDGEVVEEEEEVAYEDLSMIRKVMYWTLLLGLFKRVYARLQQEFIDDYTNNFDTKLAAEATDNKWFAWAYIGFLEWFLHGFCYWQVWWGDYAAYDRAEMITTCYDLGKLALDNVVEDWYENTYSAESTGGLFAPAEE